MGNLTGNPRDLREVLALANSGQLAPTPINLRPHDHAMEAIQDLYAGRVTGRLVLVR